MDHHELNSETYEIEPTEPATLIEIAENLSMTIKQPGLKFEKGVFAMLRSIDDGESVSSMAYGVSCRSEMVFILLRALQATLMHMERDKERLDALNYPVLARNFQHSFERFNNLKP